VIVYGGRPRRTRTAGLIEELAATAGTAGGALGLLLDAGALAQGLLDADFARRGHDEDSALAAACGALTLAAVQAWQGAEAGLAGAPAAAGVRAALAALAALELPAEVDVVEPEGYAFYALYPEMVAAAAAELPESELVVIGVRSIGTSLAAVVAAVRGAAAPVTVRPVGHPFARELRLGPRLTARLRAAAPRATFAVVDEGPGLSGSSFGAVADWLEGNGVAPARLRFLPSHAGAPGRRASARHRRRWEEAARHVVEFEAAVLRGPRPLAARLAADGLAPDGGLVDLAGGRWRALRDPAALTWPPANPPQERRKYLLRHGGRALVAKFAGLGRPGERQLARARRLASRGLIPAVHGLCHGFLVSEWLEDARPLPPAAARDRAALADALARHLAAVAQEAPPAPGAAPVELLAMARANTAEALGEALAGELDALDEHVPALARVARPVATDNRLHAWEWLVTPGGALLKTDALEHHAAHDLIGAQDLAWDLVGAAVELELAPAEEDALYAAVARAAPVPRNPAWRRFYGVCYLAFQLGAYAMAAAGQRGVDDAEAARLDAAAARYARHLGRLLGVS
jgi:hypothetical protein